MSANTEISWTDHTFNPWWGCSKVSPGCLNCYADTFARRLGKELWGKGVPRQRTSDNVWAQPIKWNEKAAKTNQRARVFCASMADIFDAEVPPEWREETWNLIRDCQYLDWQLLTKRPENIAGMLPPDWGEGWRHVWLGATAENQEMAKLRVPILREIPAAVRFLSCEPLVGPVVVPLHGIQWVICGGESGARYRPMQHSWAASLRDSCVKEGIPFHFKQWGTNRPKVAGRLLDGRTWDEFPKRFA